ncbi:hypothetical protein NQD34_009473, partial [Periophthalmus magnuspinnatus]
GFDLVLVGSAFPRALRSARSSEYSRFQNARIARSFSHHERILVVTLHMAFVLDVFEVRTSPFWERGDFVK